MNPTRIRARELRAAGHSYQQIADTVGCCLASAWRWTHDIPVETADEHDGRRHVGVRRPLTAGHRAALSMSMLAVWQRQRARHAGAIRRAA